MDNFESYIRQKLQNYTEEPSAELWSKIQRRLRPWYAKPLGKLFIATTVSLALLGGGLYYWLSQRKAEQKPITAIKAKTELKHQQIAVSPSQNQDLSPEKQVAISTTYHMARSTPSADNTDSSDDVILCFPLVSDEDVYISDSADMQDVGTDKLTVRVSPTEGCEPLEVNFDVEPPKGMNIAWFVDKQKVADQSSFSYTFNAGTHYVQLVVYNDRQTVETTDTIHVVPRVIAKFEVIEAEAGKPLKVKNLSQNADSYEWIYDDGTREKSSLPHRIFNQIGLHRIKLVAKNRYCSDTMVKLIEVKERREAIRFPNAFVPSLAGPTGGYYNPNKPERSIFHPVVTKPVVEYELRIYDRRGRLLFQTNDIHQGWDGYYHGKLVPVGVYLYIAQGRFDDGQTFTVKGDITVLYEK